VAPVLPIPVWGGPRAVLPIRRQAPWPAVAVPPRDPVPMQFIGVARDIRRHVARMAQDWGSRADALLEPFQGARSPGGAGPASYIPPEGAGAWQGSRADRGNNAALPRGASRRLRKVDLVRLFHGWKKLPASGRLGALTITLDADQVKISELRLYPGRIIRPRWQDCEDTLDVRQVRIALTTGGCAGEAVTLASVGLHALARRCERGSSGGLSPILADLQTLGAAYQRVLQGPNIFRVAVPGGEWVGIVLAGPDSRPQLTVRTFIGAAR